MVSTKEGQQKAPAEKISRRYTKLDGHNMRHGVRAGLAWLKTHQQVVNSLNVFPVPDGDTGTNMLLTMQAAWEEVENKASSSIGEVAQAVAQGALMGARGNSGVILSQLWRGFARAIDGHDQIGCPEIVQGFQEARDTAYKGVVRPVEGTILTVSKDIAAAVEQAHQNGTENPLTLLEVVVEAADRSVENTPELLPVLKEAGVVDSGGKGLFLILEGMLRAAYRLPLDEATLTAVPLSALQLDEAAESIEPGQDWEVVVDFKPEGSLDLEAFYSRLEEMGTSIQVGEGDGIYRMHIHVPEDTQYVPIDFIRELGTVTRVSLENLQAQMEQTGASDGADLHLENISPGQIAVVAVAPGPGIARVFASLGAAAIIEGGQTMNPSTEEILQSFENLPTEKIIVLPNNKNIHMAANQTSDLTVKDVRVIASRSVPQGVTAMLSLDPDGDIDEVSAAMTETLDDVAYGELTKATRSVEIDGVQVQEGQIIGLLNGKLIISGEDLEESLLELLSRGGVEEAELVSLYYGKDMEVQHANKIADKVRQTWSDIEVELLDGGQPHYRFILSIE